MSGTQVQGDGLGGFDKLGFMLGLGVEMDVGKKNTIGFEMNLLQKGSKKAINPETNSDQKYKMVLTYIQVPVYFNFGITEKISALAGPAIGFLVASKEVDVTGSYSPNPPFNTLEFSGILGAQYRFTDRWRAEVRFDQSLTSIRTKGSSSSPWLIGKQYNTSLGVYICFTMK
jgi:opacity protein-like surface antigen